MNTSSPATDNQHDELAKAIAGTFDQSNGSLNDKKALIAQACWNEDIEKLVELADSPGGLIDDALRKEACKQSNQHH